MLITTDNPDITLDQPVELQRIQRKRTAGWRMPENTVSVTRPGKWGNPFRPLHEDNAWWVIDEDRNYWGDEYATKEEAIAKAVRLYKPWIEGKIDSGQLTIGELRGKNLACFCADGAPCHADILLEIANKL